MGDHDEVEAVVDPDADDPDEDAVVDDLTSAVDADPPVIEADLPTALAQRDEYLEALQRVKAEFDNFRKRTDRQRGEMAARAAEGLVRNLLPVLDACEAAQAQGASDVEPIAKILFETLEKEGLERLGASGDVFDPNVHEAVLREESDDPEPVIAEVLRGGYRWKGTVVRTAMVKVRG
jgi:molecular chaperone GrpE